MSPASKDIVTVLLTRRIISQTQLAEARQIQCETGAALEEIVVHLGYVTARQVALARAESLGVEFLDLAEVTVPPSVLALVPESVARENLAFPVALTEDKLTVALADPTDFETLEKLRFILNRKVRAVLALREQIIAAINRYYGQSDTESVDSMLLEFTDTAIEFTETEAPPAFPETSIDLEAAPPGPSVPLTQEMPQAPAPGPVVERHATVRYYHRMTHGRMFPLLVILSQKAIAEAVKRGVSQGQSRVFEVEEGSVVEVEPMIPGCSCYPPIEQVPVGAGPVSAKFWVLPHALGRLQHARVVVRQKGTTLAEVPLEMRVVRQTLTLLMGGLSLLLPFLLMVLKYYRLDFESQAQDGFGLYAGLAQWLIQSLTPEVLTGVLLALTVAAYFWLRPRKRDVFWDVNLLEAKEAPGSPLSSGTDPRYEDLAPATCAQSTDQPDGRACCDSQAALLRSADQHYEAGDYAAALQFYERGLGLTTAGAVHYLRASLAAYQKGDLKWALAILNQAEQALPPSERKGAVYYNMGCFAARLGRYQEAVRHLNRAVDAGYVNPEKYRTDPDLEPLRWHPGFKSLLVSLGQ
jgi:hypothetical protein